MPNPVARHHPVFPWSHRMLSHAILGWASNLFQVSLVIERRVHCILGIRFGTFTISRPTLSCSYWWELFLKKKILGGHKSFLWDHDGTRAYFLTLVIPRFSSGAPAECIETSMAARPFQSMDLQMCPQALVEVWGSNRWPSTPHTASTAM